MTSNLGWSLIILNCYIAAVVITWIILLWFGKEF